MTQKVVFQSLVDGQGERKGTMSRYKIVTMFLSGLVKTLIVKTRLLVKFTQRTLVFIDLWLQASYYVLKILCRGPILPRMVILIRTCQPPRPVPTHSIALYFSILYYDILKLILFNLLAFLFLINYILAILFYWNFVNINYFKFI